MPACRSAACSTTFLYGARLAAFAIARQIHPQSPCRLPGTLSISSRWPRSPRLHIGTELCAKPEARALKFLLSLVVNRGKLQPRAAQT